MPVKDWSTTAASNTSVGGKNIAENMNPGDVNDAIRAVIADAKTRFDENRSVTDFGAVGDGVTDCTTAFQNAINAAAGSPIFVPAGKYIITAKLTSSGPVHIFGVGNQSGPGAAEQDDSTSSYIIAKFANPTLFEITSKRASIFRDIKLGVDAAFQPPASGSGIHLLPPGTGVETVAKDNIQNVTVINFYQCIRVERPNYPTIRDCYFGSWISDAIYFDTDVVNTEGSGGFISNNYFFGNAGASAASQRSCVYLGVGYTIVFNNEILGANVGVLVKIANTQAGFIRISSNTIEEQYNYGITVATTSNVAMTTLDISRNEFSCIANGANYLGSIYVDDNSGTNYITTVKIEDNQSRHSLTGAGKRHIRVGNGKQVSIRGNQAEELGAASPIAIEISGAVSNAGFGAPVTVANNTTLGTFSARYVIGSGTGAMVIDHQGVAFASLPANVADGSFIYCTDGTFANPVAGSGTGCFAKRLNGAWRGD